MKSLFYCLLFFITLCVSAQETQQFPSKSYTSELEINYFYGSILLHNPDISHLITGHPTGFIAAFNKKTYGFNAWESRFNYPDYGGSFIYQDLKNEFLGDTYSVYGHYNFYFLKRNLQFRIGQGIALATNPYNRETNYRNNAFGTKILSSTFFMLNYTKPNLYKGFGLKAGVSVIHYSNANVKAPNTSTNTFAFSVGATYNLHYNDIPEYQASTEEKKFKEPIKFNIAFRSGINESDVVGTGQFPFYIISAYADKRLNRKSSIQLGTDVFFSKFLEEHIKYTSIAFLNLNVSGNEDYKRVGVFVGHELFINKMSIITQLGYYVYYPFDFEGRVYNRIGLKRYFGKKLFAAATLKSHSAKAEAVEFGIGIRL